MGAAAAGVCITALLAEKGTTKMIKICFLKKDTKISKGIKFHCSKREGLIYSPLIHNEKFELECNSLFMKFEFGL